MNYFIGAGAGAASGAGAALAAGAGAFSVAWVPAGWEAAGTGAAKEEAENARAAARATAAKVFFMIFREAPKRNFLFPSLVSAGLGSQAS